MTYTPNPDKLVRERVLEYLAHVDDTARPGEIAVAVDSKRNYVYKVLSALHDDGLVVREELDQVIGHPMPDGGVEVLPTDRDRLLDIIAKRRPSLLDQAKSLPAPNIRSLIESEIAVGEPHPLGNNKVAYGLAEA